MSPKMSSATARAIPLDSLMELKQNTTSFECRNGTYRELTRLESGNKSHVCRPCSPCPCGVKTLHECNSTMDTLCTQQCEDPNAVFNQTLGACVSLLGVLKNCSHTEPQSVDYPTTVTLSTLDMEFITRTETSFSPLCAFGISTGILVLFAVGTTVVVLIARRRGYLHKVNKLCCRLTRSSPRNAKNDGSPAVTFALTPRGLARQKYENLIIRLDNIFAEEPARCDTSLQMSIDDISLATEEDPFVEMPQDLPLAEDIQVNLDGEGPYWLVMRGWFTPRGGVLRCEESDVFLVIPAGAIPDTIKRQEIVAKVAVVTSRFNFNLKKDEVCLSPVVELLSPGLDSFKDLVTIHIPHRAQLDPDWSFKVHYTCSHGNTEGSWQTVEEEKEYHRNSFKRLSQQLLQSDVSFKTNKTHFVIQTPHFSKYTCSGCGKKRYLNLEALVSAKYMNFPNRQQVDLNCYIVDTIKDYWHRVNENEGQRPRSERHPIHLKSKEPLVVSLLADTKTVGMETAWEPSTYGGRRPTTVAIPMRNIVRCCSDAVPYFVTFSLRPKGSENHSIPTGLFESVVCYKQKESSLELPITIAFDLQEQSNTVRSLSLTPRSVSPVLIRKVSVHIPLNRWKDLFRHLLTDDDQVESLIEELQAKHADVGEVKYQMLLTWRNRKGRNATCYLLSQSLRACRLVSIAEMLESGDVDIDLVSPNQSTV